MIGFKAFDKNLKCRCFQYEIGHTYEFDGKPIVCKQGFHFCKSIAETYKYYPMSENVRICRVEAIGEISTDDELKYCTNRIKICEEVTEDWKRKGNTNSSSSGYCNTGDCNTGDCNTGYYNTGDCNTGHRNTGDYNTGNCNTGYYNTGDCNTGDWNTGEQNTGIRNTGDWNTGNWNTGDQNTGDWNTGEQNTGNRNTGDWNTGDWNTGDWNTADHNSGCFNTTEKSIWMFDKSTDWSIEEWRRSAAYKILRCIPREIVEWIPLTDMSDDEKEKYPSCKTTGGYLKVLDNRKAAQDFWNGLSECDKQKIYDLPNFDSEIFKQCTGIEVKE